MQITVFKIQVHCCCFFLSAEARSNAMKLLYFVAVLMHSYCITSDPVHNCTNSPIPRNKKTQGKKILYKKIPQLASKLIGLLFLHSEKRNPLNVSSVCAWKKSIVFIRSVFSATFVLFCYMARSDNTQFYQRASISVFK